MASSLAFSISNSSSTTYLFRFSSASINFLPWVKSTARPRALWSLYRATNFLCQNVWGKKICVIIMALAGWQCFRVDFQAEGLLRRDDKSNKMGARWIVDFGVALEFYDWWEFPAKNLREFQEHKMLRSDSCSIVAAEKKSVTVYSGDEEPKSTEKRHLARKSSTKLHEIHYKMA